ncbi:magnesium transporter NIPA-domain-containing protein [Dactylonectria estremocensis]|uniref:Magnesium transporter NIPA-domain-containing protein n=1 Tax=Dactylonectria estremocensis TaxID=1079267 RepID=A0A9P9J7J3_9HYPO|nr:magnesium transporter NIPA-domain-containing protein [Dactylonectria estremocensis]
MLRAIVEPPGPSLASNAWPSSLASDAPSGGDSDGDPTDNLQEWSSLIGIVTAIVGNVLIALALNVQRYAHIQLHKERHRIRRRARHALKRAQSKNQTGLYGTLGGDSNHNGYQDGNGSSAARHDDLDDVHVDDSHESDPLRNSFHSNESNDSSDSISDDEQDKSLSYLRSPYWWLGQVLITLGEMGNFLAYGFAPASIVSPLGVVALISNCIIAPAMFHERFRARDFWGVVIAVGGVVTVVLSAKGEETKLNPHDVLDAITTLGFEIYLGVTIFLIVALMWASPKYGKDTILIDLGLVGLFGGYTALATKGVSSMLSSTLWRAFTTPVTYILIVILLLTAIMQIRYVNKALQRFDSTQVIPIQFVMFTLCVIIGSAVLYRDFERTTAEQAAKFIGGCLLTFFGVFLITSGREQSHDDDDALSDTDGVEETIGLARQDTNGQDFPAPKSQSRRSSWLSQASCVETLRVVTPLHDGGVPSVKHLGSNGLHNSPGQEAPIHSNPWNDVGAPSTPPGQAIRAFSADTVLVAPGVDTGLGPSTAASNPTTPLRDVPAPDGALPPRPNLSPIKSGSTHHRSRTFISPSPLSSTVTAVVKDAFLRSNDNPRLRKTSMRRIRSHIRAGLFFNDDEAAAAAAPGQSAANAAEAVLDTSAFGETDDPTDDGDQEIRRRSRSVSDTLGDFFGVRRKRRKDDYFTGDVEEGIPESR